MDVTPSPAGPPEVRRREPLTFPRDGGIRSWQELDHGPAPWVRRYFHLRNRVEHFNGYAKAHEALDRGRTRCIRGVATQTFLLSFKIAHANEREINSWLNTHQISSGQPAKRRPSHRHKTQDPHNRTLKGYVPAPGPPHRR